MKGLCQQRMFNNKTTVKSHDMRTREWYQRGKIHWDGDQPSVILSDGTQEWYNRGKLHRDGDQPALIRADGTQEWYKKGKRHRDGDQPALIRADGTREWYQDDKLHRDSKQPAVIRVDGTQEWYRYGYIIPNNILYAWHKQNTLIWIHSSIRLPADVSRFLVTTFIQPPSTRLIY